MPEQQITNPGSAYGYGVNTGFRTVPMVNGSTSTMTANSVVAISSASAASPTLQKFVTPSLTLENPGLIGVLDKDCEVGAIGDIVVEGFHLIAVSSSAIPAIYDLLGSTTVVSQSTASNTPTTALVKTSTATQLPARQIAICVSTALDSTVPSSTNLAVFVPAYIHKM